MSAPRLATEDEKAFRALPTHKCLMCVRSTRLVHDCVGNAITVDALPTIDTYPRRVADLEVVAWGGSGVRVAPPHADEVPHGCLLTKHVCDG